MTERTLQAELDQRCVAGLAAAACALVGGDPTPICRTFAAWKHEEARRSWPWLPGLCWSALEPLAVAFPSGDQDAVTLGRLLVGVETDPERVRRSLAALQRHEVAPPGTTVPGGMSGADSMTELRRRTLETVVDRFWSEYADGMRELREPVASGDRPRADALVVRLRRRLEETAERVDVMARRLADTPSATAPQPAPRRPPTPFSTGPVGDPTTVTAAAGDAVGAAADTARTTADTEEQPPRPEAPAAAAERTVEVDETRPVEHSAERAREARSAPVGDGAAPEPHPEDVEYRVVRDRPLAPVLFVVGVTLGALVWLLVIVGSGS